MVDASNIFSNPTNLKFKGGSAITNGSLDKRNQLGFYRVNLTQRSDLRLSLDGLDDDADLAIYKPDRHLVAASRQNDDTSEFIERTLEPGEYIVRVNRISGSTNYKLTVREQLDPGGGFFQALPVRPTKGLTLKGRYIFTNSVSRPKSVAGDNITTDLDYYSFRLNRSTTVTTTLDELNGNADLGLYNSRRKRIKFSSRGGESKEEITRTLQSGTYYVLVNPQRDGVTRYRLQLSFDPIA